MVSEPIDAAAAAPLPPSLARLLTTALTGASDSRARQLRWVAGELAAHAATLPPARHPATPASWFSPGFTSGFLTAADAGELRRRGEAGRPTSEATRRVRRRCLRVLAQAAGQPDPTCEPIPAPLPKERAEPVPARLALAHLSGTAARPTATAGDVRAAAMAALAREASMRSGELADLTPDSLDLAAGTVTFQPRPPSSRQLPPVTTLALSGPTLAALRRWLEVRARLTRATPWTRSLWVSLAANHDGSGRARPAGLPLEPNGVRRAHARAVATVNLELAGTPGYSPLPATVGRLRDPSATERASTSPPAPPGSTLTPRDGSRGRVRRIRPGSDAPVA